jgi:hypothetical protein
MKKIFTLIAATFLTVALFAADRRPVVTLKASRNYEVVIDGRSYSGSSILNLSNIRSGQHTIKVYEMSRGFMYRKAKRLVDASAFQVRNNDVDISIDFRGQIRITEDRFGRDKWNDKRDNDRDNDYGRDQRDRHDQDMRDNGHSNDKNDRDKRF